jgi:DNA-binding NtrC family response regulator
MANVTLLGFPRDLAAQLGRALVEGSHTVTRKGHARELRRGAAAGVVFVCGDAPDFLETLSAVRKEEPGLPVVVATRMPETRQWLDALEAGAADYCGAPFENLQVRWIMSSVLAEQARQAA